MEPRAEEKFEAGRGMLELWMGLLLAPAVWLTLVAVNFALVPWACAFGWEWLLHLITLAGAAFAAIAGMLAWRNWRAAGREPEDTDDVLGRARFMAGLGVLLSAIFFLTLAGQEIANVILGPCE